MTSNNDRLELRQQAEEIAQKEAAPSSEDLESRSPEGTRQMLHELRVHQIELEMQNEELRRTQAELEAARARYFDLYDLAPVGYCTLSEQGLILETNLTAATLLGVARGALVKQPISRFIFPEDQDSYYRFRKQLFETGTPQACELRMRRADAAPFWARLEATVAPDAAGAPGCRVVLSDITARRQIEEAQAFLLQCGLPATGEDFFASLARYLAETLRMEYVCIDRLEGDGLIAQTVAVYNEGQFESNVRYALKDTPCGEVMDQSVCYYPQGVRQLFPRDAALQDLRAESYFGTTLLDSKGRPIGLIAVIGHQALHDPKRAASLLKLVAPRAAGELERRQVEEAVRESEERHRTILQTAMDGFWLVDPDGRLLEVNETYCRMSGYSARELLAMRIPDLETAETADVVAAHIQKIMAAGEDRFESRHRCKNGSIFDVEVSVQYQPVEGGRLVAFLRDITDRKRAEQTLRESEARLRAIVQAVPDVLLVLDGEGRYVEVLTARPELLYTEPKALQGRRLGERLAAAVTEQVLEAIRQTLRTRQIQSLEYELSIPKVGPRTFEVRLAPLDATLPGRPMVVLLAHDITQRRLTEESLRQAQKMEAVGQLTGGMAHDFNNLLAIILGNLELLAEQLQDPAMGNLVQEALVAVERGASLTHRLLAFSRRQPLWLKRTDLNQLVAGMSDLLHRSLGETIVLRTRLAENLLPTVIDPGQFEAALLNLVVNARDAMPQGGQLTIETANYWLHEDAAHTQLYKVEPGQYVMLAVGDTGSGMAPDVQRHAFEPFFTTKEVGQGSGLGLSMVYGLVKQSGGFIHLDSEVGQGTTLRLYLPAAGADAGTAVETPSEPVRPRSGQQQTILMVEDESAVRRMAVRMLESLGYQTVEADTAATALAVLDATPQVAALFTDVVLPGPLSGVELARQAVQRRPDLKVLFTSGYTEAHLSRFSDRPAGSDLLEKPYRKPQLAEKLHALLDRGAAAESG